MIALGEKEWEKNLNKYGNEATNQKELFVYGLGNFASQLSWTMVSTYLSIFYTDVFGLGTGAVALLMLIAKVWDGINDPMMGTLMERTHTKWGKIPSIYCCWSSIPCDFLQYLHLRFQDSAVQENLYTRILHTLVLECHIP